MNKKELIETMMKDKESPFESKAQAEKALKAVLNAIKKGLKSKSKSVQLIGFGTFRVKKRKARKGVNPQTKKPIKIPASKTVAFRPGKALKEYI
ncbi:MAG: HU family DNA-binding protein [Planctomycetota bacterium]|nr:MAG: HU family DNA-binding protein [Planctomycetota bacterium]